MTFTTIILCTSAFIIQCIAEQYSSVCVPVSSCGCGSGSNNVGAFTVQSAGPLAPSGIAAAADLSLAADLAVSGTAPFLSAVEFCGQLPTSGAGAIAYGCGDGAVGISRELGGAARGRSSLSRGCGCGSVSNNAGAFTVQSAGPLAPSGMAAAADLSLAADLAVSGAAPFLNAVEFCGQLPTSGVGAVAYCRF